MACSLLLALWHPFCLMRSSLMPSATLCPPLQPRRFVPGRGVVNAPRKRPSDAKNDTSNLISTICGIKRAPPGGFIVADPTQRTSYRKGYPPSLGTASVTQFISRSHHRMLLKKSPSSLALKSSACRRGYGACVQVTLKSNCMYLIHLALVESPAFHSSCLAA